MANKYTFKTFLEYLKNYAKVTIKDLATKELTNVQKKRQLDRAIELFIVSTLDGAKLGFITKFVIDKFVLKHIPEITQFVYDLLKSKIEGVTK